MRSPEPSSPSTAEALLHGQFASWGSGSNSNNNSCPNSPGGSGGLSPATSPSPASNYALTLTHTHIHIQRLSPKAGKEARLLLPLSELVGCSCPRAPAPPLLVLYWYPPGKRRKGVSRRRQVRAYLAESRCEAERWSAAVQCLLRGVTVTADTGELTDGVTCDRCIPFILISLQFKFSSTLKPLVVLFKCLSTEGTGIHVKSGSPEM